MACSHKAVADVFFVPESVVVFPVSDGYSRRFRHRTETGLTPTPVPALRV